MSQANWIDICAEEELVAGTGLCALFGSEQVAIFKLAVNNLIYAVSNYDPIAKANVISRGIVGSIGDRLVVASPLYKQHFCLETGECLDAEASLATYAVRSQNGIVQLLNAQLLQKR